MTTKEIILKSKGSGLVYEVLAYLRHLPKDIVEEYFHKKSLSVRRSVMKTNSIILFRILDQIEKEEGGESRKVAEELGFGYTNDTPIGVIIEVTKDQTKALETTNKHLGKFESIQEGFAKEIIRKPGVIDEFLQNCKKGLKYLNQNGTFGIINWYSKILEYEEDQDQFKKLDSFGIYFIYDDTTWEPMTSSKGGYRDRTVFPLYALTRYYLMSIFHIKKVSVYFDKGFVLGDVFFSAINDSSVRKVGPICESWCENSGITLIKMTLLNYIYDNGRKLISFSCIPGSDECYPPVISTITQKITSPWYELDRVREHLNEVNIINPNSVSIITIGTRAFRNCKRLEKFTYGRNIKLIIGSEAFCDTSINDFCFNRVARIDGEAFQSTKLKNIELNENVCSTFDSKSYGHNYFSGDSLETVIIRGSDDYINSIINSDSKRYMIKELALTKVGSERYNRTRISTGYYVYINSFCHSVDIRLLEIADVTDDLLLSLNNNEIDPRNSEFSGDVLFRGCFIQSLVLSAELTQKLLNMFKLDKNLIEKLFAYMFKNCSIYEISITSPRSGDVPITSLDMSTADELNDMLDFIIDITTEVGYSNITRSHRQKSFN